MAAKKKRSNRFRREGAIGAGKLEQEIGAEKSEQRRMAHRR